MAVIAADLLDKESLTCFSHVPLFPAGLNTKRRFGNESAFARITAATKPNIRLNLMQSESISPLGGLAKYIDCFDNIIHAAVNAFWMMDIREKAAEMGIEIVLTGKCGNLALSYKGKLSELPYFHPSFLAHPMRMLRTKFFEPRKASRLELERFKESLDISYVNYGAIEDYAVLEDVHLNKTGIAPHFATANEEMLGLMRMNNWQTNVDSSQMYPSEWLDPTADVRVIEHCLAIPNEVFFDKEGNDKQVLCRMMQGRLPDKVLFEKRKGMQAADIYPRVIQEIDRVEAQLGLYERNHTFQYLIDTKKLNAGLQGLKSGHLTNPIQINQFLKAVMLGMFLDKHGLD